MRASRDLDGKNVFAIAGRGGAATLIVNSPSGKLADTDFSASDRAAHICPVGAILIKEHGFPTPIGERPYDRHPSARGVMPATSRRRPMSGPPTSRR